MMKMYEKDSALFTIGIAARVLQVHPQTLRLYERLGFIVPHRTKGKTRLYSQRNLDAVTMIITLTRRYRVNLAGVGIIMKLQNQIEDIQHNEKTSRNNLKELTQKKTRRNSHLPSNPPSKRSQVVKIKVERG